MERVVFANADERSCTSVCPKLLTLGFASRSRHPSLVPRNGQVIREAGGVNGYRDAPQSAFGQARRWRLPIYERYALAGLGVRRGAFFPEF